MVLGDREFTSEEVAAMCGVTRVTVADWISRGRLDVRWTSGGHRRVPRVSLAAFMKTQGYSVPRSVEAERALAVVMDSSSERAARTAAVFDAPDEFEVLCLPTGIEALLKIGSCRPDVVIFVGRTPGFDTRQFIEAIRRDPTMNECALVALMALEEEANALRRLGVDIMTTPERLGELRPTVVRWLTEHQRRASPDELSDADRSGVRTARRPSSPAPEAALIEPATSK